MLRHRVIARCSDCEFQAENLKEFASPTTATIKEIFLNEGSHSRITSDLE